MVSEAPPFWWEPLDWRARMLAPAAAIYGKVAAGRMARKGVPAVAAPVICVGNFTVGGTGKTPVSIALAAAARSAGFAPGLISRGHGGSKRSAHAVDLEQDSAAAVGDEPLLLARQAPVAVSPKRIDAAQMLVGSGCDFLIMDDGFQSARLLADYSLLVVDARHGVGNARVIPAGPLRAPLVEQLRRADGVLLMGQGNAADAVVRNAARAGKPVFQAEAQPLVEPWLSGGRFLAFAGIGHPSRFFDTVRRAGGDVVRERIFPDHHVFSLEQLTALQTEAREEGLQLVTTEKDAVRLTAGLEPKAFRDNLRVLKITAQFENPDTPAALVRETAANYRLRRFSL